MHAEMQDSIADIALNVTSRVMHGNRLTSEICCSREQELRLNLEPIVTTEKAERFQLNFSQETERTESISGGKVD